MPSQTYTRAVRVLFAIEVAEVNPDEPVVDLEEGADKRGPVLDGRRRSSRRCFRDCWCFGCRCCFRGCRIRVAPAGSECEADYRHRAATAKRVRKDRFEGRNQPGP